MTQDALDTHSMGCFCFGWPTSIGKKKPKLNQSIEKHGSNVAETTSNDIQPKDVPTARSYAMEGTKKTLEVLSVVASVVPVPLVKQVLDVGVNILSICETLNEVEEQVTALKNRIVEFLLAVAKIVKDKENSFIRQLSEDVIEEMEELKTCLTTMTARLERIQAQNRVLTALLPKSNKEIIDECLKDFQYSIDKFQTLRGIHAAQDLAQIQLQVEEMYGLTQEVVRKVDRMESRVQEVKSAVDELKAMMDRNSNITSFTAAGMMPRVPSIFFGRTTVVDSIARRLCTPEPPARICILGPGGQGKTSTALAVMNHPEIQTRYPTRHRYWVPCISANSPSTFLTILAKHLQATSKSEDPLQAIFAALSETEEPCLILLDNFETPWHPVEGSQQAIKEILHSLDSIPHVNILITMRSEFPPLDDWVAERLSSLELDDARAIYMAIDKETRPSIELDELLAALGYLPYAITLMATRGKRSLSSPAELLEEWKKSGTDMLSKAEGGMDHSIELSVNSKFVSGSPGALHLLQVLSMLPAGVLRSDLSIWIKSWESDALETLRDAALVRTTEVDGEGSRKTHLFVLPVVQSYMHRRDRIPASVREDVYRACCDFLVTRPACMTSPSAPNYRREIADIAAQETNLQALLTKMLANLKAQQPTTSPSSPKLLPNPTILPYDTNETTTILEAGLVFSAYQFWTKPRFEMAQQVIALAEGQNDSWREAQGRFCLGHAFWRLSAYREAAKQLWRTRDIYLALSGHARAIRSEFMAIICTASLPETTPEEFTNLFSAAFAKWATLTDDAEVKAWFLHYKSQYALLFQSGKHFAEGLEDAETSARLFEGLKLVYEANISLFLVARCHSVMGDYQASLKVLDSSAQELLDQSYGSLGIMQDLGPALFMKARTLKALGRWEDPELMNCLTICLKLDQEVGLDVGTGQCLAELAEIYMRKGDLPAARLAYEEAIKKCSRLDDPTGRWVVRHASHNLRYVENKENGTPDENIVFEEPLRY